MGRRSASFSTNGKIGTLYPLTPALVSVPTAQPWGLCLSPYALDSGKNLYVGCGTGNAVHVYTRDINNGKIVLLESKTTGSGRANRKVKIPDDGKHVYSPQFSNLDIAIWSRNLSTGALTATTARTCSATPFDICFSSDGAFAYSSHFTDLVSQWTRDTSSGLLSAHSAGATVAMSTATDPQGIVITPDQKNVYCACNSGHIAHYTRDTGTGALTFSELKNANNGVASGWPAELVVSSDSAFLYVALDTSALLAQFSISPTDGTLTALSTPVVGSSQGSVTNGPWGLDLSPDGTNLFMTSSDGNFINMFRRNTSTGLCTANTATPAYAKSYQCPGTNLANGISSSVAGPYNIVVSGNGLHAYCTMAGSQEVAQFNIHT